jgi:flagellar hook-associated protein 2
MNVQGMFSFGGIASGLDTETMIRSLMQLERQPVVRMQSYQAQLRKTDEAWKTVNTKLAALRTAVDALSRPDRFNGMTSVTSTHTDIAEVAKSGSGQTGSLSFSVNRLATAHQISASAASATDPLGLTGPVTIQIGGGEAVTLDNLPPDASLTDVAQAINAKKLGASAQIVKVSDTESRLILTGDKTGAANQITLDGLGPTTQLRSAVDAEIVIGGGDGGTPVTVTRASNTVDDLVSGATITLRKADPSTIVTVTASQDVEAGVAAIKSYVDAVNDVLTTLKDLTAYNMETKTGGPLTGESAARNLANQLRTAASAFTGAAGDTYTHAFQVGMGFDKHGVLQLDEAKLTEALTTDFAAVGRLFSRSGSATSSSVSSVLGTSKTASGTYDVQITSAATVAQITGTAYTPPDPAQPRTFTITSGGTTATVTIDSSHATADDAAGAIRAALQAAGISTIDVGVDTSVHAAGQLTLTSSVAGTAGAFTVTAVDDPTWTQSDDPQFISATEATQAGTYLVDVTAGTHATHSFANFAGHANPNGSTLQITNAAGASIQATVRQNATAEQAAADINAAIANGITAGTIDDSWTNFTASNTGTTLTLRDDRVGAAGNFTLTDVTRFNQLPAPVEATGNDRTGTIDGVEGVFDGTTFTAISGPATGLTVEVGANDTVSFDITINPPPEPHDAFGLEGSYAGTDAIGQIAVAGSGEWTDLTASGQGFTVGTGPAEGLSFRYSGSGGETFELTYSGGLAGTLSDTLRTFEGTGGLIAGARSSVTSRIKNYQDRIDAFDHRLSSREATLRQQFTAMERMLSSFQAQGSWMTSQINSLNAMSAQNR